MIYMNERFLTIQWDSELSAVWMEWKEFADGETFRWGLDAGLDLLINNKTGRWLADLRNLGPIAPADQQWSNEDWFPRAIAGGVRWMALVAPKRVVARMAVRTIMSKVEDRSLVTAYFDELPAAREWLRVQK